MTTIDTTLPTLAELRARKAASGGLPTLAELRARKAAGTLAPAGPDTTAPPAGPTLDDRLNALAQRAAVRGPVQRQFYGAEDVPADQRAEVQKFRAGIDPLNVEPGILNQPQEIIPTTPTGGNQQAIIAQMEQERFREGTPMSAPERFAQGLVNAPLQTARSAVGLVTDPLASAVAPRQVLDAKDRSDAAYEAQYGPRGFAGRLGAGVGQVAVAAPLAAAGGLGAGAGVLAASSAEQGYQDYLQNVGRDRASIAKALSVGGLYGAAEYVAERIGLGAILRETGTRGGLEAVKGALRAAGVNASEEALTQVAQNAISKYSYDPGRSLTEGAGEAGLIGGVAGGVAHGAMHAGGEHQATWADMEQLKATTPAPIGRGTTAQVPDGAGPPAQRSTEPSRAESVAQPSAVDIRRAPEAPPESAPLPRAEPKSPETQSAPGAAPSAAESPRIDAAREVEASSPELYPRARQILDELGVPDSGEVAERLGITLPEADRLVGRWEEEGRTPAPATGDTPEGTAAQDAGSSDVAGRSLESSRDVPSQKERPSPNSTRPALGSSRLGIPLDVVSEATRQREAAAENIARQSRPFAPPGRAEETQRRSVLNRFRNPDTAGYSTEGSLTAGDVFPREETRAPERENAPPAVNMRPREDATKNVASADATPKVASATPDVAAREPWQMTRDELERAVSPKDRAELQAARPLLRELFPADDARISANEKADPWGIHRAVTRGDELPRVPTVDLSSRHRKSIERAIAGGRPVPPAVLADYPDLAASASSSRSSGEGTREGKKPWEMTRAEYREATRAAPESALRRSHDFVKTDLAVYIDGKLHRGEHEGIHADIVTRVLGEASGNKPYEGHEIIGGFVDRKTGGEFWPQDRDAYHKMLVRKALSEGRPVPAEVLADYPDLKQAGKPEEQSGKPSTLSEGRPVPAEVLADYPELGGKGQEKGLAPKNEGKPAPEAPAAEGGERPALNDDERIFNGHRFDRHGVPVNFTHTGDKVPIAFDRKKTATDYLKSIKKAQRDTLEAVQGPSGRWWLVNKSGRVEAAPESSLSKLASYAAEKAAAIKAAPDIRQAGKGFKGKGGRAGASDLGRVASYAAWKAVELGAKAGERIRVTVEQAIEHLKRFGVETTEANAKRVAKMANAWIGSAEKPDGTIDPGRLESAREAGMRRTRIAAAIGETKIRLSEQGKAARVAFNKGLAEGRRTAIDKLSNAADAEGTSRKAVLDIVKALPVGSRGRIEYVSLIARAKTLNDVREAARMVAFDLHREVVKQQLTKTERLAKYKNLTPELKADLATVNKDVAASLKGMAPQWAIREALAGKKKGDMIAARVPMKLSDAETTAGQVQLAVGAIAQKIATHRLDLKIAAEDQARTADYLAQNVAGRVSAQTPDTWTPIWGRDRTARAKFLGAWSRLGYTVQQLGKLLDNTQGKPEQGYAETLLFRRPLEGEGRVAGEMQRTMDTLDELARKHGYKSFLEAEDEAANNYIDDTPLGRITWEEALTIAGLDPETKALFEQGAKVVPHGDVNKAPDQLDQERQKRITDKLPERAVKLYRDAKRAIYEEQYRDRALREIEVLTGTRPPTVEDYQPRRSLQQHNFESGVVNGSPDGIITVEHMLDAQRLERASFGKERIAGPNATFVVEPAYVVMKRQAARAAKIIHLARAVRDARSVFARQEVQHAIQKTFGRGAWRAVQRQIKQMSMLNPMSHDVGFSRTMKAATRNVGRALTQLNPASFLRQYGTVFNAMHDFGWARGVAALRFGASGKLRAEMIASHPLLRQRYETGQGFQTAQAVGGAGRPTKAGSLDTEGLRVALKGINRDIRRGDLAGAWRNISSGFDAIKLNNIADAQVTTVVYGMAKEDARAAHPEASEERIRELAGEATALWVHRRANTSSSNSSGLWVNNVRDNPSFSPLALFTSDRTKIFNMIVDAKHEGKAKTASAVAASGLNALWSQSVGRVYRNVALYALASALWGSEAEEEKKNLWGRNFIASVATDMLGSLPGGDAIGKAADAALSAKKGELDSLLSNPVTDTADAMYGIVVKALSAMTKPAVELERDKAGGVTVESLLKAEKSAQSWSGLFAKAFDASATLAGLPFAVARRDLSKLLPEKSIGGAFDKAAAQYGRGEMDYATETVARTYKAMLDGGVRPKAARDALVSRLSYRLGKDAKDKPAQKRAEVEAKKLVNAGITKANE